MELLLYGRYIIMIFSPLSSQFRINFCKNLQKIYCINSVLYSKCLPCTKNAISRLTSGPQKSFTTLFSPDRHRKKAQYSFYHKNLEKGNKITNNEGYRFFGTPCRIKPSHRIKQSQTEQNRINVSETDSNMITQSHTGPYRVMQCLIESCRANIVIHCNKVFYGIIKSHPQ